MIYITGDTHGDSTRFKQFKRLWKRHRDYCIVCGDFGFVWNGSDAEQAALKQLEALDVTLLFVEGTHDNLDLLERYPLVEAFGAKARKIAENVYWLQRGTVYEMDEKTIFAMGGGESEDADDRISGESWWHQEMPTSEEIEGARQALSAVGNRVDLIVTHVPPRIELGNVSAARERINVLTAYLESLLREVSFTHWFFGSVHLDRPITPTITAVFEKVVPAFPEQGKKRKRG